MNLRRVETLIVELNRLLVAAILAIVFAIVFINVVGRYGFSHSFAWVEEAARHLMILGAFCGAGLALREGRLVAIVAVSDLVPARFGKTLRWIIVAIMAAFMGTMLWLGISFVEFGWSKQTMSTGMSRGIPYLSIPIGCGLFLIQLAFFARRFVAEEFELDAVDLPQQSQAS